MHACMRGGWPEPQHACMRMPTETSPLCRVRVVAAPASKPAPPPLQPPQVRERALAWTSRRPTKQDTLPELLAGVGAVVVGLHLHPPLPPACQTPKQRVGARTHLSLCGAEAGVPRQWETGSQRPGPSAGAASHVCLPAATLHNIVVPRVHPTPGDAWHGLALGSHAEPRGARADPRAGRLPAGVHHLAGHVVRVEVEAAHVLVHRVQRGEALQQVAASVQGAG